jgi:hypothetical protein
MRNRLAYGVPIAAGLLTGGYALSQGEDPGSAALAAGAGALGGRAGLLGARALAGKYSPVLVNAVKKGGKEAQDFALEQATKMREGGLRQKALLELADVAGGPAAEAAATQTTQRVLGRNIAAGLVPAAALTAGLGGVALGAIPGAMGLPGFQQGGAIDPESPYVSQNPRGLGTTTMQYDPRGLGTTTMQYV